ncbi:unnamed protein product, partial [Heterosigma akashiwo]
GRGRTRRRVCWPTSTWASRPRSQPAAREVTVAPALARRCCWARPGACTTETPGSSWSWPLSAGIAVSLAHEPGLLRRGVSFLGCGPQSRPRPLCFLGQGRRGASDERMKWGWWWGTSSRRALNQAEPASSVNHGAAVVVVKSYNHTETNTTRKLSNALLM